MTPITLDGHPVIYNSPPPDDARWFQKELDRIFGLHSNGYSKFRIVYGQDLGEGRALDWDHTREIWRARYVLYTNKKSEMWFPPGSNVLRTRWVYEDIGVPRWFIERYIPPEVACRGWVVEGIDSEGDHFYDPKPINGIYEPFADSMIADHTLWCCAAATEENRLCYGTYRAPDDADLEAVREAKRTLDELRERRPGPTTAAEADAARKRSQERYDRWNQSLRDEAAAIVLDGLRIHQSALSEDPSVVKHGRFHWTRGHSKSGLKPIERDKALAAKSIFTGDKTNE